MDAIGKLPVVYFTVIVATEKWRKASMMSIAEIEDLIQGFVLGQLTAFHVGWWSLLVGLWTGVLWWLGGIGWLGYNAWRRIGIPVVMCLAMKWHNPSGWPYLGALAAFGAFSLGYGTPSLQPLDEGSWLGRKFGKWARLVWWSILLAATGIMFL